MKIIFMGSAAFSIPSLEALLQSSHRVAGVITNQEKPAGRGLQPKPTPVAALAAQHAIETITPATLKNNSGVFTWIQERSPEAVVVVAYGKLIPPDILHLPPHGCLNVHPSLLPAYRGAAPVQRALLHGDEKTGVTIMLLDEGMDSGPVLIQEEMAVTAADDAATLGKKLAVRGAAMLLKTLDLLEQKRIEPVAQRHEQATLAPRITKAEGRLDFNKSAVQLHNTVRALIEWPGTWITCKGELVHVLATGLSGSTSVLPAGYIINIDKHGIHAATGEGVIILRSVKPAGGKAMDAFSYANGRRLKAGDVLG